MYNGEKKGDGPIPNANTRRPMGGRGKGRGGVNPGIYVILLVLAVVLYSQQRRKRRMIAQRIQCKQGGNRQMQELAKKFVGQECIVHTFDNNQIVGILREVSEKGLLLERSGASEALNLDYVVRIREYPKKKNGRKKSIVMD